MLDLPDLPEPWFRPADHQVDALRREALAEIGPGHDLAGRNLLPVAKCSCCDDVVFQVDDGTFAIVHLTWTGHLDRAPSPTTRRFQTIRALLSAANNHRL
jgi:hypothetical protein